MVSRIFLLLLLLLIWSDLYIYRTAIRPHVRRRLWRSLWWLPSALLVIVLLFLLTGDNFTRTRVALTGYYVIAYLTIVIPKSIYALLSLLGKGIALPFRHTRMGSVIPLVANSFGRIFACVGMFVILYGCIGGWRRFTVKEVTFAHPDVPQAFDGYRVVQISDWHLGTIARHPRVIEKAVELVNAQQPDLIAFTGDLVNNEASELDGLDSLLSRLTARDGVFSILGNHDYGTYHHWESKRQQAENLNDLKQRERSFGWHLLLNENRLITHGTDTLALIGVENDGKPPFPSLGNLPKATRGTEGCFKILLSHDPTHWKRKVLPETDIPLTLSGHTHAMQFRLGDWSPSAWFYPEWSGLYRTAEGRALYVNEGLGSVMIPFRFGAWPEITVITLQKK